MDQQLLGHIALSYSPIIDRNRNANTTRLTVFPLMPGTRLDAVALLRTLDEVWPVGGSNVALNILSEHLLRDVLFQQPATHFMLEVPAFMAAQPENLQPLQQLHANGNTLLLKGRPVQQLPREVLPLLHLLVFDTDNPRSLAWVARTLRDRLRKLARQEPAWVERVTSALPTPENWGLEAMAAPDAAGRHSALIDALGTCSEAARTLSDEIDRQLFVHVVSPERSVWL